MLSMGNRYISQTKYFARAVRGKRGSLPEFNFQFSHLYLPSRLFNSAPPIDISSILFPSFLLSFLSGGVQWGPMGWNGTAPYILIYPYLPPQSSLRVSITQ